MSLGGGTNTGWPSPMIAFKQIFFRILATFAATGLSVVGAGAIVDVPLVKAFVIEGLARAYMDDGVLTTEEINDVFSKVDKKSKD